MYAEYVLSIVFRLKLRPKASQVKLDARLSGWTETNCKEKALVNSVCFEAGNWVKIT